MRVSGNSRTGMVFRGNVKNANILGFPMIGDLEGKGGGGRSNWDLLREAEVGDEDDSGAGLDRGFLLEVLISSWACYRTDFIITRTFLLFPPLPYSQDTVSCFG